ncbi:MAG: hypothetical protein KJ070_19015 [Verrucomicrobia bacterium]|nr:hypothetical protein [Verrucomicrobiota bacterium]
MKPPLAILLALAVLATLFAAAYLAPGHFSSERRGWRSAVEWQRMANPGQLSQGHAFLDHNCNACHTPVKGVETASCIVCHANNSAVLQRQPTAFHADIGSCVECHREHQGRAARKTQMDHAALAHIGCKMLERTSPSSVPDMTKIQHWLRATATSAQPSDHRAAEEALLNCATCHRTKDKHFGLFGMDCAACHATDRWTIPEFHHPSPASPDCAQCHQAPPSHYMEHFKMISMTVADQPHARVEQCFLCHQTTAWNDIKRVGWYKHH